jgi:UPF0755 protein
MKRKHFSILFLLLLAAGAWYGFRGYQQYLAPNTIKTGKLYIPTHASYLQVLDSLRPFLKNERSFSRLAKKKRYPARILAGRYSITAGENNRQIWQKLALGRQDEIPIRIGNYSSIFELAGKVAPYLECDSAAIVGAALEADFTAGMDTAALLYFFVPNTYNFHWNLSGMQFIQKMKREFDAFWTAKRLQEADSLRMSPLEVTTLASIVQLESTKPDEQPRVAGLYLNRLRIGMKLDADPTVIFAMKVQSGFSEKIYRVYYKDLLINSPYNTYRNKGLPPGPICMPNPSAIDAVLSPENHDYLYFVADPQRPGYHIYARTLNEQEVNARKYREWLDRQKIN